MRKQASGGLGTYSGHVFLKFPVFGAKKSFIKAAWTFQLHLPPHRDAIVPLRDGRWAELEVETWGSERGRRNGRRAGSPGWRESRVSGGGFQMVLHPGEDPGAEVWVQVEPVC